MWLRAPSVTFLVLTPRDFEFLIKKTQTENKIKPPAARSFVPEREHERDPGYKIPFAIISPFAEKNASFSLARPFAPLIFSPPLMNIYYKWALVII